MKLRLAILLVLLFTFPAFGADTIPASGASKYVGQKATVCGVVASATYASRVRGQPTFLNLDEPYPRQVFTVVIWGSDRRFFDTPPEVAYRGKRICVSGMIESYRGKPEIVARSPGQITVIGATPSRWSSSWKR